MSLEKQANFFLPSEDCFEAPTCPRRNICMGKTVTISKAREAVVPGETGVTFIRGIYGICEFTDEPTMFDAGQIPEFSDEETGVEGIHDARLNGKVRRTIYLDSNRTWQAPEAPMEITHAMHQMGKRHASRWSQLRD